MHRIIVGGIDKLRVNQGNARIIFIVVIVAMLFFEKLEYWGKTQAEPSNIYPLIPSCISESVDTFAINGDFLDVKTSKGSYRLDKNTGRVTDFKKDIEHLPGYYLCGELLISSRTFDLGDGYALTTDKTNPEKTALLCFRNNKLLWRNDTYPVEFFTPSRIYGDFAYIHFDSFQGILDLSSGQLVKRVDEKMSDFKPQAINNKTTSVPPKMTLFDQDVTIAQMSVLKNGTWEKLWDLPENLGWSLSIQKDTIQICKSSGILSNKAGMITIFDKMAGKQIEQIKPSKIFPNNVFFDIYGYVGGVVYGMAYDENVKEAYLYAFDVNTNEAVFEYPLATRIFTDTTIENDEDSIYAVLKSGLSRINLADGTIVWNFPTSQDNHYYDYDGVVYCNGFEVKGKETFENVQIKNGGGFLKIFTSPAPTRNTSCQTLFPIENGLFLHLPYMLGKDSAPRIIGTSGIVFEFSLDLYETSFGRLIVRKGDKFFIACGNAGFFIDANKRYVSKKLELKRGDYFSKLEKRHLIANDKWIVEGLAANGMVNVLTWNDEKIRHFQKTTPFFVHLAGDYCAYVSEKEIVALNLIEGNEKRVDGEIVSVLGKSFLVKKGKELLQWNPETDTWLEMNTSDNPSYLKYLFAEGVNKPVMLLPAGIGELVSLDDNKRYSCSKTWFIEFIECPSFSINVEYKCGSYCIKATNVSTEGKVSPLSLRFFVLDKSKPFARLNHPVFIDTLKPGHAKSFDIEAGDDKMIYIQSNGLLDTSASSGIIQKNVFFDGQLSTIDENKSHVFLSLGFDLPK